MLFRLSRAACIVLLSTSAAMAETGAVALFISSEGLEAGSVTLSPSADGGVRIEGRIIGLSPGDHALVAHEAGDCDPSSGFASAGAAIGDAPILVEPPDDTGTLVIGHDAPDLALLEGTPDYVFDDDGTALVLYAGADASGVPFACAVIEAAPLTGGL